MLDLNTATLKQLVAEYNRITGKSVNKFADRATGIKKLKEVLPKESVGTAGKGRKGENHASRIKLLVEENPKREGTESYTRFELYRKVSTVREFLENGGTSADIRWDAARNFIKLDKHSS